jgi:hypothetical protein
MSEDLTAGSIIAMILGLETDHHYEGTINMK